MLALRFHKTSSNVTNAGPRKNSHPLTAVAGAVSPKLLDDDDTLVHLAESFLVGADQVRQVLETV